MNRHRGLVEQQQVPVQDQPRFQPGYVEWQRLVLIIIKYELHVELSALMGNYTTVGTKWKLAQSASWTTQNTVFIEIPLWSRKHNEAVKLSSC